MDHPPTFSQGKAEADAVVYLRVGNWLGDDKIHTFYDATILEVYSGTIEESITLLQAGSLQTCTYADYPLFVYGDEFVLFLKKATSTDSPYENAYYICGGPICTIQVYYNAEGEQFVEDSFYFISNQHLPLEVQAISSHLFPNPPGAEYASLGAVYLGNTKLYKLSDIVPYLNGTAEDLPIQSPCYAKRIWSFPHSYDSESSLLFSVTVPELGNAVIEQKEDGKVYINDEKFLGGLGYGCESFYLADVNGDSKPELCFGTMLGSGIVNSSIEIFDYETKKCIFYLSDRMNYDYHLFIRNGVLCVKEIEYMKPEINRTGMLIHDGTQVSVLWDSEVNATPDRDTPPAS